jgi:hypothetical protein
VFLAVALVAGLAILAGPSVAEEAGGTAQPTTTTTGQAATGQSAQQQDQQAQTQQAQTQQAQTQQSQTQQSPQAGQPQPAPEPAQAQAQQQQPQQTRQPTQAEIDAYWKAVEQARLAARAQILNDAIARRDWLKALEQYNWNAALAHKVVWCESRFRPEARNGRHHGLFQIRNGSYDPAANIEQAYRMYQARGWRPWYASRRCWRR